MSDSTQAEAPTEVVPNGSNTAEHPPLPRLDVQQLHSLPSEQQDLYLFTFAVDFEKYTSSLSVEELTAQQSSLNEELFQIIDLKSPAPSKAIRNNVGRAFAKILGRGNRRTLFDTINHLTAIVNAGKGEKELYTKHAAVHCLGEVYKAAGDSALNLSGHACASLLRLIKPTRDHTGLRAAIFQALAKIVIGIERSIDELVARDIWKQCRKAIGDEKTAMVQSRVCTCIEALVNTTSYFDNVSGFEDVRSVVWKASETRIPIVRHTAAACLARFLVKSYSPDAVVKMAGKQKKKKPVNAQDPDEIAENGVKDSSRPMSPASGIKKVPEKLMLSLSDIFRHLAMKYTSSTTTNRTRATIVHCYCKVLKSLGPSVVEGYTYNILDHLLTDLLSNPIISHDRHKLLLTRKFVQKMIVGCIGITIFGESGRLSIARSLINNVLKNFPQVVREIPQPSKHALVGALDAVASLIQSVGSAFRPLADSCREALVQVLQHPSYTVQIYATHCLRTMVEACPQQLLSCASICMNGVIRELSVLNSGTGGKLAHRRCMGCANALAAVISVFPTQPLYGSLEISSRVLTVATDLLKSSSQADLRIADTQVQVSWILIGGLMALGPNFVKIHLSQFLLLWKNSLPKPLTKDNTKQRQSTEIHYLTSIRECTLGSILLFLDFNTRLLTVDVSKRIAVMLQNTIEYLDSISSVKFLDDSNQGTIFSLSIQDLILMVKRRVLQCFCSLIIASPHVSAEIVSQSNLLTMAVTLLADPDSYTPGSLSSSIANASGTFESIWDVGDNSGFGVTGLVHTTFLKNIAGETPPPSPHGEASDESGIDQQLSSPILGGREHDSICLHSLQGQMATALPDPPATEVVNAAISFFAVAYPLQTSKVQEGILEQIAVFITSPSLQRDPGRKAAVTVNAAMALLASLKVASSETRAEKGDMRSQAVDKAIEEVLRSLLLNPDQIIRRLAYEAIGRLCNSAGNAFTSNEVDSLIETIVSNRDPNARAGCSMALGSIHSHVGGMAAGLHMKKIHGVLMSLCSDPNPIVHLCALKALSEVADSAGLAFSSNVSSTLGLLAQLWTSDSHNEQSASANASTLELEAPTAVYIAHCLDSLVNVLGPDIQDMAKVKKLMLTLMLQFELDENFEVQAECLKVWEHMSLYDSPHVDLQEYVQRLQRNIDSPNIVMRDTTVDGLYNLVRRDADLVLSMGQQKMEDQLWATLNDAPYHEGTRNITQSWLSQTGLKEPEKWIKRCQHVLTKISPEPIDAPVPEPKSTTRELPDEEVAGFNVSESKDHASGNLPEAAQELLRWQVRAFALQCLNELVDMIGKDIEADPDSSAGQALQDKLSDVIRLAFVCSTAAVTELQVGGLGLIDQLLKIYGPTPDPDFSEALLLEQYQAQISSALTPAFAADSSPDLASAAVKVCATFLSAGLVTDVDRMGRILRLLVTALESLTDDAADSAIGDLRGLSTNAQTMVRLSVLSAWAELQVASTHQGYLIEVVKPFVRKLTPLWLSSLQMFARLRFEPDISGTTGPPRPDEGLDVVYAALNRQTLLKFFQVTWLKFVEAIASLIDQDSEFVFDALDGRTNHEPQNDVKKKQDRHDINYRDEPAAFFFVLFGIVVEALTIRPGSDVGRKDDQTLDILAALKRILKPSIAGTAIFEDAVFGETMALFDRLALTEGLDVQLAVVDIVRSLCLMHPSARRSEENEDHLSEDIEQMFELTRIIVLVLAGLLPNLSEQNPSARPQLPDEGVIVIQTSLEALVNAAEVFPSIIKSDLHASILHIFGVILGTGACQANVVPQALPVFKRFLHRMTTSKVGSSTRDLIRSCLHRFTVILAHAQRREAESSLACAKNTLLAITILITTASRALLPNDQLAISAVDAIRDCLQDHGIANVAANCLRTLLLVSPKNELDEAIAECLLPHLIHFTVDTEMQDPENARLVITQALTSFVSVAPSGAAPAAMCIILPTLLTRAAAEGKEVFPETAKRLVELAGGQLTPLFKGCVNKMSADQKSFMEKVIREGGGAGQERGRGRLGEEREEPSIALKFNFG